MTRHAKCAEWTVSLGRVVKCTKNVGHDGNHWALNMHQRDVVWDSVTLSPPAPVGSKSEGGA